MMDTSNTPTKQTLQVIHRVCISMYKLFSFYDNNRVILFAHFFVTSPFLDHQFLLTQARGFIPKWIETEI